MTGAGAVAVLVAITGLSLFYRSCLGVIAPELSRDLGPIVGAFPTPDAVSPEIAYRWAFGAIALTLAAGLAVYLSAKDAKPSAGA